MNYTLMSLSSLKYKGIQTAITLWNQHDIRALKARLNFPLLISEKKEWQKIEDKVTEKVQQLLLPKTLQEETLSFIKPIGLQILKWKKYNTYNLDFDLPDELFWTPQGTVDPKKTAEVLIKKKNLDIERRYRLACIYCLEDDIKELWTEMPENCREYYRAETSISCKDAIKFRPIKFRQHELVVLWTYDINGEGAKIDNIIERQLRRKCSPYQYAFECAVVGGNKVATEYFLQKLTPEERKESLGLRVIEALFNLPKEYYAGVLCFLLSQMDEGQQTEVFKSKPFYVLECFLDWPWQDFFMETANRMWNFLSETYFYKVLWSIVRNKGYNYQNLFREFWQGSPTAHKEYVIDYCVDGDIFLLFEIEDKENIKLILKDATAIQRENIILSSEGKDICSWLIYNHKWDLLQFFVQECISSKNVMIKFKEEFKEHTKRRYSKEELEKDVWKKFFQLLDDLIQGTDEKDGSR